MKIYHYCNILAAIWIAPHVPMWFGAVMCGVFVISALINMHKDR